MDCIIEQGYALGCTYGGGAAKVWIGTYIPNLVPTYASASNLITGITNAVTPANKPIAFSFEQDMESAQVTQAIVASRENLSISYDTTLTIKMFGWTNELRNILASLDKAPLFAVIKPNVGEDLIYLGLEYAGRVSGGDLSTGKALGDMNGVELSIIFKSTSRTQLMSPTVLGTDITLGV